MVAAIIETGRCGWYFRVLEIGDAQAGDDLERVEIGHEDWSVGRCFSALIAGKGPKDELRELAKLDRLAPRLRAKAEAKLD